HVQAKAVSQTEDGLRFIVNTGEYAIPVMLDLEGEHFVSDALAAVAVGLQFDISLENIRRSLLVFHNMAGRQEIYQKNGYTVIQDCYNAGPESMNAALNVLGKHTGRRVAVLGDMLELGVCTDAEHYKIGRVAAKNADILLAFGPNSTRMIYGAITGGMSQNSARAFTDKEKLVQVLRQLAKPGDTLLFKGSRGMRMEQALEMFFEDVK
ncbi:MAG: UDP-N-acetylmuramoyl-tripeptide--D-alanyl-D-alanine ligase, partial [Oscillospiraceae bacterium]|nr:UDP-N-acetylmuramoyl-tripeptide--D-alanyl-D-alanine ligase [Oscillospiraceae bacterium]